MRRTSSSTHKCSNRFSDVLRFGFGFEPAIRDGQAVCRKPASSLSIGSFAGTDKLGILSKAQLFDHIGCNVLRFQNPNLTFDPSGIRLVDRRPGFAVTCPSAARSESWRKPYKLAGL